MDELHRKILRENRRFIIDNLSEIESIIDGLLIKGILTESMRQDILVRSVLNMTTLWKSILCISSICVSIGNANSSDLPNIVFM